LKHIFFSFQFYLPCFIKKLWWSFFKSAHQTGGVGLLMVIAWCWMKLYRVGTNGSLPFQNCWEVTRKGKTSKHTDIKLQLSRLWIRACACICNDLLSGILQWRKLWLQKAKCSLWFNETKSVKLVQQCYWTRLRVYLSSKPFTYACYNMFCETGIFV
jgi:hypothetical protein